MGDCEDLGQDGMGCALRILGLESYLEFRKMLDYLD